MRLFTDAADRVWHLELNGHLLERVISLTKINPLSIIDDSFKMIAEWDRHPGQLIEMAFALLADQAEEQGVTLADFKAAIGGDQREALEDAFIHTVVDFFPSRRRPAIQKLLQNLTQIQAKAIQIAEAALSDPQLAAQIDKALKESLQPTPAADGPQAPEAKKSPQPATSGGEPSGNSPASLECTQDSFPCDNSFG